MPSVAEWVSGIRPPTRDREWQRRVFSILTGDFIHDAPGDKTAAAEAGLGIAASTYWYILRSDARFGYIVFVWIETDDWQWSHEDGAVAPFDTGGLWHDKFVTSRPLDAGEKRKLVDEMSIDLPDWKRKFDEYVIENYQSVVPYIRGHRPATGFDFLVYGATNEAAAWTWEARVARTASRRPLDLRQIFWTADDRQGFERWVTDRDDIDEVYAIELLRRADGLTIDVPPSKFASDRVVQYLTELHQDE